MMYIEDVQYMLREEEINWFQRAKTRDLLRGIVIPNIFRWWQTIKEGKRGFSG